MFLFLLSEAFVNEKVIIITFNWTLNACFMMYEMNMHEKTFSFNANEKYVKDTIIGTLQAIFV